MLQTRPPVDVPLTMPSRLELQRGYALVFVLLFISSIGMMIMFYQLGNSRNDRYQIYYALGQEFAMVARAAHIYVQDHAYYTPYITDPTSNPEINRLNYYESLKDTKIATYREPLGEQSIPGENVITLNDLRVSGSGEGFLDTGMTFDRPVRGVEYTFFAHGGLLPLHAAPQVRAASSLLVMYGRAAGALTDVRTMADMAAFRAGAASNGLGRVGIVLPDELRQNLRCRGGEALVVWGNNDSDCLTPTDATAIGIGTLDPFDVVAPAWEAVDKQLDQRYVFRRPHPGLYGTNVMQQDIDMDSDRDGKQRVWDASEIYTGTVNIDTEGTAAEPKALQIGKAAVNGNPAPQDDAILTVSYGRNTKEAGEVQPCASTGTKATTCLGLKDPQLIKIEGNMAVSYSPDPKDTSLPAEYPEDTPILTVKTGVVDIQQGDVTVSANERFKDTRGFFDVKGIGPGGNSTFKINKQDQNGNGGTVINEKVTLGKFTVKTDKTDENFIVDKDLIINGGNIQIGDATTPAQVVLTTADLKSGTGTKLDIDTTGKGSNSGVYSRDSEIADLEQTGTSAMTFKTLNFTEGKDGSKPQVKMGGNFIIDPNGRFPDNGCVGTACPDQVYDIPDSGGPL